MFKTTKKWALSDISTNIAHALDIYAKDNSADFLYREVLTSFETMFGLVAPNRAFRSENSDIVPVPANDTATTETFLDNALEIARTESIQWRTLYQAKPEVARIPFLDFFATDTTVTTPHESEQSLLYRIVRINPTIAGNGAPMIL